MNNYRKYTTKKHERKVFATVMAVIVIILLGWLVYEVCDVLNAPVRPDTEHPLVNSNISWEQTWHKGAWSDAL